VYPRYYALRRLNPYRGVVQVVDVGEALALSYDGLIWHLRADDGYGWNRPIGVWVEGEGLKLGHAQEQAELLSALETRPALPFPLADQLELWLLNKETGLPMALLAAERPSRHSPQAIDPEWHPFVLSYTGFRSSTLAARDEGNPYAGTPHRDTLSRLVNQAARPYAAAQWFRRNAEGGGEGLEGLRLEPGWQGRSLTAEAFPELIVSESWNNRLEQSVINDYHLWLAPLLLLLPSLSDATRERLEAAAIARPRWLLKAHRLLPKVVGADRLKAALVAAKLEAASAEGETDFFAN